MHNTSVCTVTAFNLKQTLCLFAISTIRHSLLILCSSKVSLRVYVDAVRQNKTWKHTYGNFGVDNVDDTAENNDEVEHVPRVAEIILQQQQQQQLVVTLSE